MKNLLTEVKRMGRHMFRNQKYARKDKAELDWNLYVDERINNKKIRINRSRKFVK